MKKVVYLMAVVIAVPAVFAVNGDVASADHSGGSEWTCDEASGAPEGSPCAPGDRNTIGPAAEHALAPVGSNISGAGFVNGFSNPKANAFNARVNNPLCPFHGVDVTA